MDQIAFFGGLKSSAKTSTTPTHAPGMRRLRAEIAPVDSHETSRAAGVDVYMGKAQPMESHGQNGRNHWG